MAKRRKANRNYPSGKTVHEELTAATMAAVAVAVTEESVSRVTAVTLTGLRSALDVLTMDLDHAALTKGASRQRLYQVQHDVLTAKQALRQFEAEVERLLEDTR